MKRRYAIKDKFADDDDREELDGELDDEVDDDDDDLEEKSWRDDDSADCTIGDEQYAIDLKGFEKYLRTHKSKDGYVRSDKTVSVHLYNMKRFMEYNGNDGIFSQKNIGVAVETAKEELSANTVNNLVSAINLYCQFVGRKEWRTTSVKVQARQFLEDIISMPDYEFLLKKAVACKKWRIYLYARIAATTGMRVSEMLQVKREHIEHGYVDLYGKGAKRRRIYFPVTMRQDVLRLLDYLGVKSGFVISAHNSGEPIQMRYVQTQLARFGEQCEFPKGLLHTHMFRHFFAKEFIKRYQNLSLLADLLGHSNIETTRIYLKFTSQEQAEVVDDIVKW